MITVLLLTELVMFTTSEFDIVMPNWTSPLLVIVSYETNVLRSELLVDNTRFVSPDDPP